MLISKYSSLKNFSLGADFSRHVEECVTYFTYCFPFISTHISLLIPALNKLISCWWKNKKKNLFIPWDDRFFSECKGVDGLLFYYFWMPNHISDKRSAVEKASLWRIGSDDDDGTIMVTTTMTSTVRECVCVCVSVCKWVVWAWVWVFGCRPLLQKTGYLGSKN